MRKETEGLRDDKRKAEQDRDAVRKQIVEVTDDLHQNVTLVKSLRFWMAPATLMEVTSPA